MKPKDKSAPQFEIEQFDTEEAISCALAKALQDYRELERHVPNPERVLFALFGVEQITILNLILGMENDPQAVPDAFYAMQKSDAANFPEFMKDLAMLVAVGVVRFGPGNERLIKGPVYVSALAATKKFFQQLNVQLDECEDYEQFIRDHYDRG